MATIGNKRILTEEESAYFRENYGQAPFKTICDYLGISYNTMKRIAKEMGLHEPKIIPRGRKAKKLTEEEIEWFKENFLTLKLSEIRERLKVSYNTLRKIQKELNLVRPEKEGKPKMLLKEVEERSEGVCIDCYYYLLGGTCGRTGRYTGALLSKTCFTKNN